ncbi:hypothetical protein ACIA5D_13265 [Actinoplanes sp. NPDC051513]|uniref:hypothetical protein n=1 Tax=Actinoplanes sp. NPDC051513 TaxID=3363908 RepID=UPI0037B18477
MTTTGWVMLAITIFGAFCYGTASILQAVGARRAASTVKSFGQPLYVIGVLLDLVAWSCAMIALSQLAVYLVESVLAGSLAITVVAARVVLKSRLRPVDAAAVTVSIAALTALAMSAGPQEDVPPSAGLRLWLCGAAVSVALLGWGATKYGPPGVVACFAGLSLGGAALVGRALAFPDDMLSSVRSAVLTVLTDPLIAALVIFGVSGMMLYANALRRGQVGPVTAVHWIAEVTAPSAVAILFLGDAVRPGWSMIALAASVTTIFMAVILATAPANKEAVEAAELGQPALPAPTSRPELPAAPAPATARPAVAGSAAARSAAARPSARPATARPATARTAAPRAVPRAPMPPLVTASHAERIIWWGPPPIWVPPQRARHALAGGAQPSLTWAPPSRQPLWAEPRPADSDAIPVIAGEPMEARDPFDSRDPFEAFEAPLVPEPVRPRPWHDL